MAQGLLCGLLPALQKGQGGRKAPFRSTALCGHDPGRAEFLGARCSPHPFMLYFRVHFYVIKYYIIKM
jgi:hypothetical protein